MSIAGLKQIALCNGGTLLTTPAGVAALGIVSSEGLTVEPFKEIEDLKSRKFPNKDNFKIDGESLQPTPYLIKALFDNLNQNGDVQILTQKQSAGSDPEVYHFRKGVDSIGIDFEYESTAEKRILKATFERALSRAAAQQKIDQSDSLSAVDLSSELGNISGEDFSQFNAPGIIAIEAPQATSLFNPDNYVEYKFNIKTKGKKTIDNASKVRALEISLELTADEADVSKLVELYSKQIGPSVLFKEQNGAGLYTAFDIAAGVLTMSPSYSIDHEKREAKVLFMGDVPLFDVEFQFGATFGGDASDNGKKGGTIKIGY